MRTRLLLLLALAAAAASILLLKALAPGREHERAPEAARDVATPGTPAATAPEAPVPSLRVSVLDGEGQPLSGARCDVEAWKSAAETDAYGLARIPAPKGVPADALVRASKEGYRPASRRGRLLEERTVKLKLLRAPPIRVFDQAREPVRGAAPGPLSADLRERKLSARGYLDLDLAPLPREVLQAWDDLAGTTPVDIFLVSDEGLGRALLRVESPGGATASVGIDVSRSVLPDLSSHLGSLPLEWRSFYASRWPSGRISPRALDAIAPGQEIRVYAEGTIVVSCLATDCRPLRQEIDIAAGRAVERALALVREAWADQPVVVTDRFGREGRTAVAIKEPAPFALGAFDSGSATLRVPRGGGPYTLEANGGFRGRVTRIVETLPSSEPIRFELKGVEVHLKLLDDESGDLLDGLGLRLEGQEDVAVRWNGDEGAYVFGPVDPGTIGVAHGTECRVDVVVDPREAEKGVLHRELRVRGFPKGAAPEPQ